MITASERLSSLQAINGFIQYYNLHNGNFKVQVKVLKDDSCTIDEQLTCMTDYNYKIDGQNLLINWSFNDNHMHCLRLHGSYNSAYQLFLFNDGTLSFFDDLNKVILNNAHMDN